MAMFNSSVNRGYILQYISGYVITTSLRPHHRWWIVREISSFYGLNSGWWIVVIYPDLSIYPSIYPFIHLSISIQLPLFSYYLSFTRIFPSSCSSFNDVTNHIIQLWHPTTSTSQFPPDPYPKKSRSSDLHIACKNGADKMNVGWRWLEHEICFSIQLGMASSQVTNSYFSEGKT